MMVYPVEIQQQARQSLLMKVTPDGVLVLIPQNLNADSPSVQTFITNGLAKLASFREDQAIEPLTPDQLMVLVDEWVARINGRINRVQIRPMRNKWASCSTNGNLTLCMDIQTLPRKLAEYVICHELVHLRVPNHGRAFQVLMSAYMPDWRDRECMLRGYTLQAK